METEIRQFCSYYEAMSRPVMSQVDVVSVEARDVMRPDHTQVLRNFENLHMGLVAHSDAQMAIGSRRPGVGQGAES